MMEINGRSIRVLGITGHVGCGKSTVLGYLEKRWGAHILELDRVAEGLQKKGAPCYAPMLALLGSGVLAPDGELDRKRVAERIFADRALLEGVNRIVHPAVKAHVRGVLEQAEPGSLQVLEAALLFEDGYDRICDEIWYIRTDEAVRAKRLMQSRGYSTEKIRAILKAQKSDGYFTERADAVIDNSGDDLSETFARIDKQMERFL